MKKEAIFFITVLMLVVQALSSSACSRPIYSRDVNTSARLCGEHFDLKNGVIISRDNVMIDCSSAVFKGWFVPKSVGIVIEDRKNVTLFNCRIINYAKGILVRNASNILLRNITFIRNMVGVDLIDSSNVSIIQSFDISLNAAVKVSNSSKNVFQYFNKNIKGDFCAYNNCSK